jgi:hypothetical protein
MDHVDRTAAAGLLRIRMLHGVDLRDVSNVKIKDVTSFADSSSLRTSGILFTLYILVALGFYTFHMRWNVRLATRQPCSARPLACPLTQRPPTHAAPAHSRSARPLS